MESINLFMNTKVCFGEFVIKQLQHWIDPRVKNVIIITGKSSARKYGYLSQIVNQFSDMDINAVVYDGISPNPRTTEVDAAVALVKKHNINMVVGLGGGSVLDAAKAIAAMPYVEGTTSEVMNGRKKLSNRRLPLIQIPTTAGTGSELSMGAIITDEESGIKDGLRGEVLLADVAIVDPTLTYSLSKHLTIETGFDILTHAIETFFSKKASALTKFFSVEAYRRVIQYLPQLFDDLDNTTARKELSYASLLMGINLANSSTCLPHRLQYPIGALTDTSHPKGLASIYKAWLALSMQYNRPTCRELALLLNYRDKEDQSAESLWYNDVIQLMIGLQLDVTLGNLGIQKKDLVHLISNVRGSLDNDPIAHVENIIEQIYIQSL